MTKPLAVLNNNLNNNSIVSSLLSTTYPMALLHLVEHKAKKLKAKDEEEKIKNLGKKFGFIPEHITKKNIDFSKDIGLLKVVVGILLSSNKVSVHDGELAIITNFNYKLTLDEKIKSIKEINDKFLNELDKRENRLIAVFRDQIFDVYVNEFDTYTQDSKNLINIEQLAFALMTLRFKNTNYAKLKNPNAKKFKKSLVSKKIVKNSKIDTTRILNVKIFKFLQSLNIDSFSKYNEQFSPDTLDDAFTLAEKIIIRVDNLTTNLTKI